MIEKQVEFIHFYKDNKLNIIVKLNTMDVLEQVVSLLDGERIDEIEFDIVTEDVASEYFDDQMARLSLYRGKINKLFNQLQERKKEKEKEKEKKEIYKERKDREKEQEKQKEVTSKKYIFLDDNDETYVVSKKAQLVLDKIRAKRQKDTDVSKWTAKQFHEYLIQKYRDTYGHSSLEFGTVGGRKYGQSAQGIIWTVIKQKLMNVFNESKLTNQDLKIYIDWVYGEKISDIKFPVTLNFLCSKSLITEWIYELNKNNIKSKNNVTITKKTHQFNKK